MSSTVLGGGNSTVALFQSIIVPASSGSAAMLAAIARSGRGEVRFLDLIYPSGSAEEGGEHAIEALAAGDGRDEALSVEGQKPPFDQRC